MSHISIPYLIERYIKGSLTESERQLLFDMLQDAAFRVELEGILDKELASGMYTAAEDEAGFERIYRDLIVIRNHSAKVETNVVSMRPPPRLGKWYLYVAVILLVAGVTYWWIPEKVWLEKVIANNKNIMVPATDVKPGDNRASLTLGDGSVIILDTASDGSLAIQGGTEISKLDGGKLTYRNNGGHNGAAFPSASTCYNTISTPRGGQYQVVLPDGSKVWLNAASSIRFPTVFAAGERSVEVSGEAYFEVARQVNQPFVVHARGVNVLVLGTSFNINSYADEASIKTTLSNGSIKVGYDGSHLMLKPGEQALLKETALTKTSISIFEETAWKDGLFKFNNLSIEPIMRQISRWYDVEILYEGATKERFVSTIPRNVPLSQVLKALQMTGGVSFEVKGKQVTVRP